MISLLFPTRGRPENIERFITSAYATAKGDIEVVCYVDDDDHASAETARAHADAVIVGPRLLLSNYWNRLADIAEGDILGHMGDDIVFRSDDWDRAVENAFAQLPDRIAFVHGRDGIQDERLGTHGFVHRTWIDALGYICPPYFSSDYNDTWLTDVADRIGRRRFLPDVYTEHLHPDVGKAALDQTHRERLARGEHDNVAALYASLEPQRAADAHKLQAVMEASACA